MRPDLLHWEVYHCTKIKEAVAETGREHAKDHGSDGTSYNWCWLTAMNTATRNQGCEKSISFR